MKGIAVRGGRTNDTLLGGKKGGKAESEGDKSGQISLSIWFLRRAGSFVLDARG